MSDALAAGAALLSAIVTAWKAKGTADEATALAALDAATTNAVDSVTALAAAIAGNKAEALKDLHDKFAADGSGSTGAPSGGKV